MSTTERWRENKIKGYYSYIENEKKPTMKPKIFKNFRPKENKWSSSKLSVKEPQPKKILLKTSQNDAERERERDRENSRKLSRVRAGNRTSWRTRRPSLSGVWRNRPGTDIVSGLELQLELDERCETVWQTLWTYTGCTLVRSIKGWAKSVIRWRKQLFECQD